MAIFLSLQQDVDKLRELASRQAPGPYRDRLENLAREIEWLSAELCRNPKRG